jgi:hypothetical protein
MSNGTWRWWCGWSGVALLASCAAHHPDDTEALGLERVEARWPAVAELVRGAAAAPAEVVDGAVTVRSSRLELGPWRSTGRGVTVELRGNGEATVESDGARIGVRRLGARPGAAAVERGLALMREGDKLSAVLGARPSGVEELAIVEEAGTLAYELQLPEGWSLGQPAGFEFLVEVRDTRGVARARMSAPRAWDASGASLAMRARVEGSVVHLDIDAAGAAMPLLVDPEWRDVGTPLLTRGRATATLLPEGKVLVVGGDEAFAGGVVANVETFDVLDGRFDAAQPLAYARVEHTTVLLRDGRAMVIGGFDANDEPLASVEIFDPRSGTWSEGPPLIEARGRFTATLLPSGKVLVVGGVTHKTPTSNPTSCPQLFPEPALTSIEIFDPAANAFEPAGTLNEPRADHSATLLRDGRLFVAGGQGEEPANATTEIWDDGSSTPAAPLASGRRGHAAVMLADGTVLLFGGTDLAKDVLGSAERFDPTTGTMTLLEGEGTTLLTPRAASAVALLPSGELLIAGGEVDLADNSGSAGVCNGTAAVDVFVPGPAGGEFAIDPPAMPITQAFRPTLTTLPTGRTLLLGSADSALLYDDAVATSDPPGQLAEQRNAHAAVLLPDGDVLVVGGDDGFTTASLTAEIFQPGSGFSAPLPIPVPRSGPSATLLRDGRVLIAGDLGGAGKTAETFTRRTGFVPLDGELTTGRGMHRATPLADGTVLLTGGFEGGPGAQPTSATEAAEIFDPTNDTFVSVQPLSRPRTFHTATLLPDGRVLVTGGEDKLNGAPTVSVDLFNPSTRTFDPGPDLRVARTRHSAVLLADGRVLIAGGANSARTEIYDPYQGPSGAFTTGAKLAKLRAFHTATLLPSGLVALVSGRDKVGALHTDVELFDPILGSSRSFPALEQGSILGSTTLLTSGELLVVGGYATSNYSAVLDRWQVLRFESGSLAALRPTVDDAPAQAEMGAVATIAGKRFSGVSEGTGSSYPSPTGFPMALWMPTEGIPAFGRATEWGAGSAKWTPRASATPGTGLVFVAANGAHSDGRAMALVGAANGVPCTNNISCASGSCEDGVCCDTAGCGGEECMACSVARGASADGTCVPVAAGEDPKGMCKASEACSVVTGVCNGTGSCTECPAVVCADETHVLGTEDEPSSDCAPYRCDSDLPGCLNSCTSRLDCAPGFACDPTGRCTEPLPDEPANPSCAAASTTADSSADGRLASALLLGVAVLVKRRRRGRRVGA